MNIHIKVIPESEQRKCVSGCDWFWDENGDLQVRVSPLSDWRYEVLLGMHEAFEAVLCKHNGVTQAEVDAFDLEFDQTHADDISAGDDPRAPYATEHCFASAAERMLAGAMHVSWDAYDQELIKTYPGPRHKQ